MIEYIPTKEHLEFLEELKIQFKKDKKFEFALHSSILAKKMRSWGYKAIQHLPRDKEGYNWMENYPCGNYDDLIMVTISLHYPNIYNNLRKDIPVGYIYNFIEDNLYPFTIEK